MCWCARSALARIFICVFLFGFMFVCLFICSFSVHVPYLFYPICPNQHGEKRFIIIFIFRVRAQHDQNIINNHRSNNNNSTKFRSHISALTCVYILHCTSVCSGSLFRSVLIFSSLRSVEICCCIL